MVRKRKIYSVFRWGYPLWVFYVIGAIELVGGVRLLIPQVRCFAVLILSGAMVGAFMTHLRVGERWMQFPFPWYFWLFSLFWHGRYDGPLE